MSDEHGPLDSFYPAEPTKHAIGWLKGTLYTVGAVFLVFPYIAVPILYATVYKPSTTKVRKHILLAMNLKNLLNRLFENINITIVGRRDTLLFPWYKYQGSCDFITTDFNGF